MLNRHVHLINELYTCDTTKQLHKNTDLFSFLIVESKISYLHIGLPYLYILFLRIGAKLEIRNRIGRRPASIISHSFYTVRIKCVESENRVNNNKIL